MKDEVSFLSSCPVSRNGKTTVVKGKKYFCTADVHSYYDALIDALNEAGFERDNPAHVFVHCGDLLDRGPDARKCLQFVNSLPRKILIKGNHEDLLEDILFKKKWFDGYDFHNGTVSTIAQISGIQFGTLDSFLVYAMITNCKEDKDLKEYLDSLIDYAEIGDHILVHGWIPLDYDAPIGEVGDWKNSNWSEARWLNGMQMWRRGIVIPGKTIVCGHWSTRWGHERFGDDPDSNDTFIRDGIVALDATTVLSEKVNVYTFVD